MRKLDATLTFLVGEETTIEVRDQASRVAFPKSDFPNYKEMLMAEAITKTTEEAVVLANSPHLAAVTPVATFEAQKSVATWCQGRIRQLETEHADAVENVALAKRRKWRAGPFQNLERRLRRELDYYKKIVVAIERGYMVIPNIGTLDDTWLVRLAGAPSGGRKPREVWGWGRFRQQRPSLPEGEGEWANPFPLVEEWTEERDGKTIKMAAPMEQDYSIAFPVAAVKPVLLERAQAAMAEKLFDELAVVDGARGSGRSGGDPILVGRIWFRHGTSARRLTFFVGWFLDCRTI